MIVAVQAVLLLIPIGFFVAAGQTIVSRRYRVSTKIMASLGAFFSTIPLCLLAIYLPSMMKDDTSPSTPKKTTPASHTSDHIPWGWIGFGAAALVIVLLAGVAAWWLNTKRREQSEIRAEKAKIAARQREARRELEAQWTTMVDRLAGATARWDAFGSDPELFLTQPAIRDVSVPEVATAIRSLMTALSLRTATPPLEATTAGETEFVKAVIAAEDAVDHAITVTKKMVHTSMSADERKLLADAQNMLARALDDSATQAERALAYERLHKIVDQLHITLPETTRTVIEQRHLRLIEAAA